MEADEACQTDAHQLPQPRNLRAAPHPISQDPRFRSTGQGYEPERNRDNSFLFQTHIPRLHTDGLWTNSTFENENLRMKCCCGRQDCAFLEQNNAALGGLEKDLDTAARLGQALLSRHESYISDSQAEQARLSTYIVELEAERTSLQSANEKIVAENRDLLKRLEHLNGSLAESDRDVKRLENLLLDCELEVKRLNDLVRKTEELDGRVQAMEQERHLLHRQLDDEQDEARSTLARWRDSERRVRELEEDVRRIELEARLDRERHEEIVARLEKERSLERELGGAEGRLKGAAALRHMSKTGNGSQNVVSHFVRDILQDNANLQAGIAELRQLLQSSNDEVENLREQVVLHQSIPEPEDGHESRRSVCLDQEMEQDPSSPKQSQQEVHVHHHYHAKLGKSRPVTTKRPFKRRVIRPGYGSISDASMPTTPVARPQRHASSPVVPLNLQHIQPQKNRWSIQSTATMSSVLSSIPSSPHSYFDRGGSMFDRFEQGEESSRPTSPESVGDSLSPGPGQWRLRKDKGNLDVCEEEEDVLKEAFEMSPLVESKPIFDANELPTPPDSEPALGDKDLTPKPSIVLHPSHSEDDYPIHKIPEAVPLDEDATSGFEPEPVSPNDSDPYLDRFSRLRPSLSRKGSHETLVSISGMDIHLTRRESPSATLELLHRHFAHSPSQTRKISTAQPLASVTEYTAISKPISVNSPEPRKTLRHTPSSVAALSGIAVPKPKTTAQPGAIGRIGGWVRGKWGIAPTKSVGNLRMASSLQDTATQESSTISRTNHTPTVQSTDTTSSISTPTMSSLGASHGHLNATDASVDPLTLFMGRSPGVNQPGSIPAVRAAILNKRTPSQVMTSVIDEEGLQEGLAE